MDYETEALLERVARLEQKVERLEEFVGVDREVDPLVEATAIFKAENRAKAKAGVKAPGRM